MSSDGSGLSGWAGYALGRMAAETDLENRQFVERFQNRLRRRKEDNLIDTLTAKGVEFLDHIKWQEGIMAERKARISDLEKQLAQVAETLERQCALTKEWEEYADKGDSNLSRLKTWADDAEASLARYRALYGPLPPTEKSSS
ncbi:MAG: hypothetical protein ABF959_08255 [Gluconobacter albidus]|uniref:hypothetical protein n=1 Tax=Gluconobacter TaxID=441 RepID=UPI002E2DB9DE|nr:hypothetical protein [Gluconobacter cadivus]